MENEKVINEELTTPQPSEGTQEATPVEESVAPEPGSKTDSALLLKSLKEEREKRRILEQEKQELELRLEESSALSDEDISDEAKVLKKEISTLKGEVTSIREEKEFDRLCVLYPILKDKVEEFNEYRQSEHPKAKIGSVAKLYLADNGFFDAPRPGLEKSTGGDKTVTKTGMSFADAEVLRKTDWRRYQKEVIGTGIKLV